MSETTEEMTEKSSVLLAKIMKRLLLDQSGNADEEKDREKPSLSERNVKAKETFEKI